MAGRITAALGSLAFLVLAPGVVAGLIPWLITGWQPLPPGDGPGALRWAGLILIAAGLVVVLEAFARFAWGGSAPRPRSRPPAPWWSAASTASSATRCTWLSPP